jgi:hypothetical protein
MGTLSLRRPRRVGRLPGWLAIAAAFVLISRAAAAPPPNKAATPLASVHELDTPVSYSETKIPLGELVRKVAADTGVTLTAASAVADEPVAVVVKQMPARELLEQLADLLDYRWARRGKPGAERYEIGQDLDGKQREAALREAQRREVERRFQEEVRRYAEMAALSQEQIQALLDAGQRRQQELEKLNPEEQLAAYRSPQERQQMQRFGAAQQLSTPLARALAGLVGSLSPQQWSALRSEGEITLSTDPQKGELPLPAETGRLVRTAQPRMLTPGMPGVFPPEAEAAMRQNEQEMQQRWAAADSYRVILRLDADALETSGRLTLSVDAEAVRSAEPHSAFWYSGGDTSLHLTSGPEPFFPAAEENTPERQAILEKDPVTGAKMSFKLTAKPGPVASLIPAALSPAASPSWRLRDLLPDLARSYDISIIADAYASTPSGFVLSRSLPTEPIRLCTLLDRLTGLSFRWERVPEKGPGGGTAARSGGQEHSDARGRGEAGDGRLIRLRSRTWFLDRPREVPLRLVRRWKTLFEKYGALPLEEYARMAATLTDAQFENLPIVYSDAGLPAGPFGLFGLQRCRLPLRLYAGLPAAEQQALSRGEPLVVTQMTPAQRELFLAALREDSRHRLPPLNLDGWASGSFSMRLRPSLRMEAMPPLGGVGSPSSVPGSGPALTAPAPGAPGSPPAFPLGSPSAARGPGVPGPGARPPVAQVEFQLRYSPQDRESLILTVAAPSALPAPDDTARPGDAAKEQ